MLDMFRSYRILFMDSIHLIDDIFWRVAEGLRV